MVLNMLIVVVTIEDTVTKRTERWFVSNIFSGRGVEKHNKRLQEEYEEEMERVVSFCCYYRYLYTSFVFIVIDMNFALHFSNLRWKGVLRYIFFRWLNHNILEEIIFNGSQ